MGAQNSKVKIAVPKKVKCFPGFKNEEKLFETIQSIEECHSQALQIASWISVAVLPSGFLGSAAGHVTYTAVTVLFTFLLNHMSPTSDNSKLGNFPNDNISDPRDVVKQGPSTPFNKSLEDALITSKVTATIAKKSVCELQAKICVVKNRHERLISNISPEDRRLEVVPAVQTCEEILQLFHDPTHVFRQNPLVSAPFLITFAGVFVQVAVLSRELIPSYEKPLKKEMILLKQTLDEYMEACVKERVDGITFASVQPHTMLHAVAGGVSNLRYQLTEPCMSENNNSCGKLYDDGNFDESDTDEMYNNVNEAMQVFRLRLDDKLKSMFLPAKETVSKFTGSETCSQVSECDDYQSLVGDNCSCKAHEGIDGKKVVI